MGVGLRQVLIGDMLGRVLHRLTLLLAIAVDIRVGQNPEQPCVQIGVPLERMKTRVRVHHCVLHEVLGVRVILAHSIRVTVEGVVQRNDLTFEPRAQLGIG
jgi:hypothetical protein